MTSLVQVTRLSGKGEHRMHKTGKERDNGSRCPREALRTKDWQEEEEQRERESSLR